MVGANLIAAGGMYYLSTTFQFLVEQRMIYTISMIVFVIFFFISLQDIAVDGWAVTMLSKEYT